MNETLDPFDRVLSDALRSRPLPAPIRDLDARAIALAQRQEACEAAAKTRARALRRWSRGMELAAAVLIAAIVLVAPLLASGDAPADSQTVLAQDYTNDEVIVGLDASDIELACGLIVVGALMYLAVAAVWAPPPGFRPHFR